jgi:hypothetical protein
LKSGQTKLPITPFLTVYIGLGLPTLYSCPGFDYGGTIPCMRVCAVRWPHLFVVGDDDVEVRVIYRCIIVMILTLRQAKLDRSKLI